MKNIVENIIKVSIKTGKIKIKSKYLEPIIAKENYTTADIKMILEEMLDEMCGVDTLIAEIAKKVDNCNIKNIYLPYKMSIGIEIESEGKYGKLIYRMTDILENGWECKGESTISNDAVEVVSPILHGDNVEDSKSIANVCGKLKGFGQCISKYCGGHIHIGADYLATFNSWKNLLELIGNTEKNLFIMSNKAGEIISPERIKYAVPISRNIEKILKNNNLNINNIGDIKNVLKRAQGNDRNDINLNEKRYYSVNFLNVDERLNTVEFRMANGTLDYDTWVDNVQLFGGIIKAAQNLAIAQSVNDNNRTDKQKMMLNVFSKIKSKDISEDEKQELLLSLVVPLERRNIYRERYIINSKLLEHNDEIKRIIDGNTAKEPIDLSNNFLELLQSELNSDMEI